MKTRSLVRFLVLTFLAGWTCQGIAIRAGLGSAGNPWLFAAMWSPLLAALLAGRETRQRLQEKIRTTGWKFLPVALAGGWAFSGGQQLLLRAAQQGRWNSDHFRLAAGGGRVESMHHIAMMLGVGPQSLGFLFSTC